MAAILSEEAMAEFRQVLTRYPTRRAAILPLFHLVQREHGHISAEAEEWIGQQLDLPPVKVHEVLTFYTMLRQEPWGRHHLQVCRTLPCMLRGAARIVHQIEARLGIRDGGKTGDGRFSLQEVECLGACGNAPVVQVNDDYHMDVTAEKLDRLLDGLK
jgi:NADH-quinone oxidoreductase E subunit